MFSFLARSFPSLIKPYQPQSQQREAEKGAELEAREEDRRQCTEKEVMEAAVPSLWLRSSEQSLTSCHPCELNKDAAAAQGHSVK